MKPLLLLLSVVSLLAGCSLLDTGMSVIWTDTPEIAVYAELFNAEHSIAKVEVVYKEDISKSLAESSRHPDIVIGRHFGNAESRKYFLPLDYFFADMIISKNDFYGALLKLGNQDGRQFMLPVSFNLPMVIMPRARSDDISSSIILSLKDIETAASKFNKKNQGEYVAMGFSPRWNEAFLPVWASVFEAGFREAKPLAFNGEKLNECVDRIRFFSTTTNGSAEAEDDFKFRYLFNPDYRSIAEGRILMAVTWPEDFFVLPEEKRASIDFKWLGDGYRIPVSDEAVLLARCRKAAGKRAADEFIKWFFKADTQKRLLERAKKSRAMETTFGIASGFSSIKEVTAKIIPSYYPVFVGKIPQDENLQPHAILPENWHRMKIDVVARAIAAACAKDAPRETLPDVILEETLSAWLARTKGK